MNVASRRVMPQGGLVLVAVLWIVAALSIMATGVSQAVRSEVRLVSLGRQATQAGADADAAILLVLQAILQTPDKYTGMTNVLNTTYRGRAIAVEVRPLSGLLDINNAQAPLLQSAYALVGGVDARLAGVLAQATVETREQRDAQGKPRGFEAIEDLMGVPGFSYDLYAKLKKAITSDQNGGGRINPLAAPYELLVVLADGDVQKAAGFAASRSVSGTTADTTNLNGNFIGNSSTPRVRLTARVALDDGSWLLSSRTVDLTGGVQDGLPFRTFHTERSFEATLAKSN